MAKERLKPISLHQEMQRSYLEYAMSVIVGRALPDARDGLKPVQRRILFAMHELGLTPERPYRKCARVVGDVLGKYHPHGDQAVYDALVRQVQIFNSRYPILDGHGNFGSIDDDPPAAMRYTETRLAPISNDAILSEIDQETVDFSPNFDGSQQEPDVLPAQLPFLILNGSTGIAVGMATSIPPHNLNEVVEALIAIIKKPSLNEEKLLEIIPGPDFPTGGFIMGRAGLTSAFTTGRGSIRIRARAEIVEDGRNTQIVVTEIPYQQSVENIEQKIADAVDRKIIDGIRELRNESAKGKTKFVIELKRDAPASVVLNNLYKHTPLQTSFAANMVALIDGVPRTINLRDALHAYVEHQIDVVTRRSQYRLSQAEDRAHIVEGLLKALDLIDDIISLIRSSDDRASALAGLQGDQFAFSERQANHILDMQLGRLTRLGRTRLEEELVELRERIKHLQAILDDEDQLRAVIKEELEEVRADHDTPRRSQIVFDEGDMEVEDLIDDEPVVITLSKGGYIKSVAADVFRTQGRGGRGVQGARLKDDDILVRVLTTTAHSYLLFFTNRGKVYRLKAYQVPMMDRTARGTAVVNLLQLEPDEVVEAVIDTREFVADEFLMFVTRQGVVKKTAFTEYDKNRTNGLIAINLRESDELVRVIQVRETDDIVLVSSSGQAIRFAGNQVRPMGRSAAGVRGMKLRDEDVVVAAAASSENDQRFLLTITKGGYGKRTPIEAYPRKGRGTMGVKGIKLTEARGAAVVGARMVDSEDEVIIVSSGGVLIRTSVSEIAEQRRDATGVRIMNVGEDETVAALSPVTPDFDEIPEVSGSN